MCTISAIFLRLYGMHLSLVSVRRRTKLSTESTDKMKQNTNIFPLIVIKTEILHFCDGFYCSVHNWRRILRFSPFSFTISKYLYNVHMYARFMFLEMNFGCVGEPYVGLNGDDRFKYKTMPSPVSIQTFVSALASNEYLAIFQTRTNSSWQPPKTEKRGCIWNTNT